jgi:hypothetical protein
MRDASVGSKTPGFSLIRYNALLVIAAAISSAAFFYFGTGLRPIWWMLWLAPVPVLAIASRLHGGRAFLLGSIAWLVGEMNQWDYLRHVIALPSRIIILFSFLGYCRCCFWSCYFVHAKFSSARLRFHGNLAYTQNQLCCVSVRRHS